MLHHLRSAAAALLLTLAAAPLAAGEAGDLIFAERGPWALGDRVLTWELTREGPALPGLNPAKAGQVTLAEETDPADGKPVLKLHQKTDAGERGAGPFPVSGGDPVLVFFLENTARDMATTTGGSPFYIRNRIKDAVFQGGTVRRDGGKVTVEMQPFAEDPNRDRMGGFQTLTLRFVMGADPKAPIAEMVAETAAPVTVKLPVEMANQPVAPARYLHSMVMK